MVGNIKLMEMMLIASAETDNLYCFRHHSKKSSDHRQKLFSDIDHTGCKDFPCLLNLIWLNTFTLKYIVENKHC